MRTSTPDSPGSRQILVFGMLIGLSLLVVLAVFFDLRRLVGARSAGGPDPSPHGGRAGAPAEVLVAPGVLPTAPHSGGHLVHHADEVAGFRLDVLSIWRGPTRAAPDSDDLRQQRHAVFEHPETGARLTFSTWAEGTSGGLTQDWVQTIAPGLEPIDGRWPTNALVGGDPALIAWTDEAPEAPARYAAVGMHDGTAYRLAYSAGDGGVLLAEFARALVTLEWSDAATPDLVPPLPTPAGRFFPPWAGPVGGTPTSSNDGP